MENTVIVFTSDNGFNCGHHGIWGKGNGTWPLNVYESSAVPLSCAIQIGAAKHRLPRGDRCL